MAKWMTESDRRVFRRNLACLHLWFAFLAILILIGVY